MLANDTIPIAAEPVIDGRAGKQALPGRPAVQPRPRSRPLRRVVFPAASTALALVISIPVLTVFVSLTVPVDGLWWEFVRLTLGDYVVTTAWLMAGVCAGSFLVGVPAAWLVTMCEFPGRRWLEYVLLLPMAVPAYLLAYTYADLLQFPGPVQTTLRGWFGWQKGDYWFPEVRSLGGAITMLTFVLYPYVYLLARSAFLHQSTSALDAGRALGLGPWATFLRVALPMARPAIAAGVAIAGMEALADYGTVKHFEVNTFSTAIYLSWFALGSPTGAAKLASGLLLFVALVLALERWGRGRQRFSAPGHGYRPPARHKLTGARAAGAFLICFLPAVIGFFIPAAVLVHFAVRYSDVTSRERFITLATNSLALSSLAAVVTLLIALMLAYGLRLAPSPLMRLSARVSTLGYAIPGAVIAVGVMLPFGRADNAVNRWMESAFGISTGLLLSGTLFTLVFAYAIRFLAIGFGSVESGLARVSPSLDEAARTLGRGAGRTMLTIHLPLLRGSLLTAALLVFVDTLKELPATLILRPLNFDTLAVRVYQLASDERLAEASTAALAIVAVGLLPVAVLSMAIARSRPGRAGRMRRP